MCKLHGFPKSIILDGNPILLNILTVLFKLNGTMLQFSTAYHPQSDGQTEVLN